MVFSENLLLVDGSAILWVVHWPINGKLQDFVQNVISYVTKILRNADVFLIFYRYKDYSIKSVTHSSRETSASRRYQLTPTMTLPPKKVVLTVTHNKIQLIDLIIQKIKEQSKQLCMCQQKLVVTGHDHVPTEVKHGRLIPLRDLETSQEEADVHVIIAQQMVIIAETSARELSIHVVADDTDIFLLLLHFYLQKKLTCLVTMVPTCKNRKYIDIQATVTSHRAVIPHLLAAHALTGCDTTAQYWGIGNAKTVKLLESGYKLPNLGNTLASLSDFIKESTMFIAALYGQKYPQTMTEARCRTWKEKTGRANITSSSKLASLPPTTEAFTLNVLRAHLQTCIWKNATQSSPPPLDPATHGWIKDIANKSLQPAVLPPNVAPAPSFILKLIKCSCHICANQRNVPVHLQDYLVQYFVIVKAEVNV